MADLLDVLGTSFIERLDRVSIPRGEALFTQGSPGDVAYIVERGRLKTLVSESGGDPVVVGEIGPGEPVGEMQMLVGGRRTATVVAAEDTDLVELGAPALDRLAKERPEVFERLLATARRRMRRNQLFAVLPRLLGSFDEAALRDFESRLEWMSLAAGKTLLTQGDPGDDMFVVVSGRLRATVEEADGSRRTVAEIARGETVGEMSVLTGEPRSAGVHAVRDSVLVRLTAADLDELFSTHPGLYRHVTRKLLGRLRRSGRAIDPLKNVVSIAIVPARPGVSISAFAARLADALGRAGNTLHLSSDRVDELLGVPKVARASPEDPNGLRLSTWLDERELEYSFVILEGDAEPSSWTERCLGRADRTLVVANAEEDPAPRREDPGTGFVPPPGSRILVLVHQGDVERPSGTAGWLAMQPADLHLHVRLGNEADVGRVARFLAGRAVGLVLGGGGARGFAHIGVVRALREAGVPIDFVGGTSMGSIVSAHVALDRDVETMVRMSRRVFLRRNLYRPNLLPIYSIASSRGLDSAMAEMFEPGRLEDLWTNCFVVSASLGGAEPVVHEKGAIWTACRASASLPGVIPPVSLGGQLHVDGGLLNNLPVDVMRRRCGGRIIASDVSVAGDLRAPEEAAPTPWGFVRRRFGRQRSSPDFPGAMEVLHRSTVLGSEREARRARLEADLCLQPPVSSWGLLQFAAIEDIVATGYEYAKGEISRWLDAGGVPISRVDAEPRPVPRRPPVPGGPGATRRS